MLAIASSPTCACMHAFVNSGGGNTSAGSQIYYDAFYAKYGHGSAGAIVFTGLAATSLFFGNITNVTLTARMVSASRSCN